MKAAVEAVEAEVVVVVVAQSAWSTDGGGQRRHGHARARGRNEADAFRRCAPHSAPGGQEGTPTGSGWLAHRRGVGPKPPSAGNWSLAGTGFYSTLPSSGRRSARGVKVAPATGSRASGVVPPSGAQLGTGRQLDSRHRIDRVRGSPQDAQRRST